MRRRHDMPFGAAVMPEGVRFRLWAPDAEAVTLVLPGSCDLPMASRPDGWFELTTDQAGDGSRYLYQIGKDRYPDPASRWQPDGMTGASAVVAPLSFDWTDEDWRAPDWPEAILYELHPGAFSKSGDFAGIERRLSRLADLGINFIELMPVAECPGNRNWGYDGVLPFAPAARYGGPAALKQLVRSCHRLGIGVILDVVYNHFGPEGNFLPRYASRFFTERHPTPWGAAINFDGAGSDQVRAFFIHNALYWLEEYHLDGLRLDAVHAIHDESERPFLLELAHSVRSAIPDRPVHLILENDRNDPALLGPFDAQWNDDFHHVMRVIVSDAATGYYIDYRDAPIRRLGRVLTEGFAYQGEASPFRAGQPRGGSSAGLSPFAFINFIQNHDQIGNHAYGWRLSHFASDDAIRAATAILLLSPAIPMLFMGQEWDADQPFPFFCDFSSDLAEAVRRGRLAEFAGFDEFRDPSARARIPDPLGESTFRSAKLDWGARRTDRHQKALRFHRALIDLRRTWLLPRCQTVKSSDYEILPPSGLLVDWRLSHGGLTMLANLSAVPLPRPSRMPDGETIFNTHEADDPLPPWYVSFHLVLEPANG